MKTFSPRTYSRRIQRLSLCATLLAVAAASALAQHGEVQGLASRIAAETAKAGKQRVAVADFVGPQENLSVLGRLLALEFTASLAWAGAGVEVIHTPNLQAVLSEQGMSPKDQAHPRVVRRLGEMAGAEVVIGKIESVEETVSLSVRAMDASDGRTVSEAAGTIPKTAAMEQLLAKPLMRPPAVGRQNVGGGIGSGDCASFGGGVLIPGRNGISYPRCLSCPTPAYSEEARREKVSGNILLRFVVTPEGRTAKISVMRSLGYGLDDQAVETVRQWVFDPARGPDGKPIAVCVTAETTFRIK